ncbi:MAG: hypothetical protein IKZ49_04765 [Alphaproteobacteria bacterium]|nr:hypothetical protein [Alphaproteobacteria bacterium]
MSDDLKNLNVNKNRLANAPDEKKIKDSIKAFDAAKERIKNKLIESDKTADNSILYTAITQFKKTNE